ncbi:HD domain-containing phosphohydrolase [Magnetococcus sp. PR-3]|uniref:HD domain-containing phosphohydrolase n=1 Tax=Magnetococcus sp. PR-3 TaxID=3120355 RepID=UPI002FCE42FF
MKPRILIAAQPKTVQPLVEMLNPYYEIGLATHASRVKLAAQNQPPEMILMAAPFHHQHPALCHQLKRDDADTQSVPLLMLVEDAEDRSTAHQQGYADYLQMPFVPAEVRGRVQTHLALYQAQQAQQHYSTQLEDAVKHRTADLQRSMEALTESRQEVIHKLARAGEFKDTDTGVHIWRMAAYAKVLALAAGLSEEMATRLEEAAPMHDIGKIGIPDAILKKPAKLDEEQWQVMRQHTTIGAQILSPSPSALMQLAAIIAEHHHERWDGSGYPHGLKGTDIPLEARIVAIADVFDALTMRRPYKEPWSVERAMAAIKEDAGHHFDPQLVTQFTYALPQILQVKARFEEQSEQTLQ